MSLETLRRCAENIMHVLVRKVFRKLHVLDPETEEAKLKADEAEADGELKMKVQTTAAQDDLNPSGVEVTLTVPPEDLGDPQSRPTTPVMPEDAQKEEGQPPVSPISSTKRPECEHP